MARRAAKESDLWFGVVDPRKRKQIQDRLAQRARRKRLAEQNQGTLATRSTPHSDTTVIVSHASRNSGARNATPSTYSVESISRISESPLSSDHRLIPLPEHSVHSAMFHNGVILGLACSTSTISTSSPASAHVPESLRPTLHQMQIVHFSWIDRIPLPRVRDKMIQQVDKWSAEDFIGDIFATASFSIKPGRMSWDPTAWGVEKGFREKWGLLFDDTELD